MKQFLEIMTRRDDALAQAVVREAMERPDLRVERFDLTESEPDYEALLQRIFEADTVHVW